jgi:2,3-dihydroxyphenylpropionate 1,2-dioxygenase
MRESIVATRNRVMEFNPDLVVLFGCDHYGGHQMASMPAFCIGVEAEALADVGGTAGMLNVPRGLAVSCLNAVRAAGVDAAVSYSMVVDHGFSQPLQEICGGVARYLVLPIFVSCLQPPFVPLKRARALGEAIAGFLSTLAFDRVLIMGTGGLSHDPSRLFPAIDDVSDEWRPYHLLGTRQSEVPQARWIAYEIDAHHRGVEMMRRGEFPAVALKISEPWDRAFLNVLERGDLVGFDRWTPKQVIDGGGFGAMEILTWIAAVQALANTTGRRPTTTFHRGIPDVGVGFAIAESDPAPLICSADEVEPA